MNKIAPRIQPFTHSHLPRGGAAAVTDLIGDEDAAFWHGELPSQIQSAGQQRRREYTTGRLLLHALSERLGVSSSFPMATDSDGLPILPPGLVGSLSHTSKYAFALVLPAALGNCGCDIETILSDTLLHDTEPEILTARDRQALKITAGALSPNLAATLVFSAKESIYKGVFPVLRSFLDYTAFELEFMDQDLLRFRVNPNHPMAAKLPETATVYYHVDAVRDVVITWTSHAQIPDPSR
jgi:enterobactin synthetase component D